ncbi:MAG: hypothetical protein KAT58_05745, partial [candidate division Zixibacteria bacterium]|nr:hypothetical protein [candidate division Zixibacteria bacterium]
LNNLPNLQARRFGASLHLYSSADHPKEVMLSQLGELGINSEMIEQIPPELEDTFVQLMGGP